MCVINFWKWCVAMSMSCLIRVSYPCLCFLGMRTVFQTFHFNTANNITHLSWFRIQGTLKLLVYLQKTAGRVVLGGYEERCPKVCWKSVQCVREQIIGHDTSWITVSIRFRELHNKSGTEVEKLMLYYTEFFHFRFNVFPLPLLKKFLGFIFGLILQTIV